MTDYYDILRQSQREEKYQSLKNTFYFRFLTENFSAHSELVKDLDYVLNPATLTCTCDQFVRRSLVYGNEDPRRLCNHLIHFLLDNTDLDEQSALILHSYLKFEEIYLFDEKYKTLGQEYRYVLQLNSKSEWLTVYEKIQDLHDFMLPCPPRKLGYNIDKSYWFNDMKPEKLDMLEMVDYVISKKDDLVY